MRPEAPGQRSGNGLFEEKPDVRATPRTRALEGRSYPKTATGVEKCIGIITPTSLVEIDGKEEAGFILEEGIDAGYKRLASRVVAPTDASE